MRIKQDKGSLLASIELGVKLTAKDKLVKQVKKEEAPFDGELEGVQQEETPTSGGVGVFDILQRVNKSFLLNDETDIGDEDLDEDVEIDDMEDEDLDEDIEIDDLYDLDDDELDEDEEIDDMDDLDNDELDEDEEIDDMDDEDDDLEDIEEIDDLSDDEFDEDDDLELDDFEDDLEDMDLDDDEDDELDDLDEDSDLDEDEELDEDEDELSDDEDDLDEFLSSYEDDELDEDDAYLDDDEDLDSDDEDGLVDVPQTETVTIEKETKETEDNREEFVTEGKTGEMTPMERHNNVVKFPSTPVKDEDRGVLEDQVIFKPGMPITEFLRNNPNIRTQEGVLKYYSLDDLRMAVKRNVIVIRRGKIRF